MDYLNNFGGSLPDVSKMINNFYNPNSNQEAHRIEQDQGQ
jgi:hypothetical protein